MEIDALIFSSITLLLLCCIHLLDSIKDLIRSTHEDSREKLNEIIRNIDKIQSENKELNKKLNEIQLTNKELNQKLKERKE
ncbi:hypothetical protein [Candidatus Phytoplasma sp. AldY-WA1]|uniref:hypothetical protein n=1 Tax=Candidatus Phytoplasma sp. AldY-WA1 TaxID=2852100 RepID=UPI00254D187C|nr:hypothetical protein [Candidatus Phytoplasma sp. AldY-WA1]